MTSGPRHDDAAGLIIAIPTIVAYRYLARRAEICKERVEVWKQAISYHEGVFLRITGLQPEAESGIYRVLFHDRQTHGRATGEDRIPHTRPLEEMTWLFDELYVPPAGKAHRLQTGRSGHRRVRQPDGDCRDLHRPEDAPSPEESGMAGFFFTYTVELETHGTAGNRRFPCSEIRPGSAPADLRIRVEGDRLLIFPTGEADLTSLSRPGATKPGSAPRLPLHSHSRFRQ